MEKHHSCLNTRAIIEYFQENLPEEVHGLFDGLGAEIEGLSNPQEFLMEINNWVSSDVVTRMFENAKRLSNNERIAFKIGFESAARKKLGYVQRIIMFAYKNPRRSLRRVQAINDKFNRNKTIDLVETKGDTAVIRLHWFKDIPANIDFCLFNQGIYTGIPTIWNLPPGILEETKCYFKGDDYCEYHMEWRRRRFSLRESLLKFLVPWRALNYTIEELERDKELLKKKFDEIHRLNIQLKEKIDQLICLQETSTAALSVLNLEKLLQVTLRLLTNSAKLDRAGILLLNEQTEALELCYAVGVEKELFDRAKKYSIPIGKVDNVIARVAMTGIPVVIQDVTRSKLNMNNPLIQQFKPKAFILAPLTVRGKVIGVLLADRVHQDAFISDGDREFIVSFANQIAIALENAVLYRKLEISERKYRELVENAHEGIWIIDDKGAVKFVNRRMREITGHERLENMNIYELFDSYNQGLLENALSRNRKNQVAQQELEITYKNRLASVVMSSVPLFEDGRFVGAFAMFSDITALRETEKRFRKVFEEAAIGMALMDMNGNLLDSNPALQKMLGYSREELQRIPYKEYTHPKDITTNARLFKELVEGKRESYTREKRYIHKSGRLVWGQVTVSMLRDGAGEPQFTIVMTEDISQRKGAEEEIRTYQGKLQSLASELSLTEERERRRLATDLHDHIGQALAISKIKLGVLQKSMASETMSRSVAEVRELIEQMIQDTRSLTFELSLPVLYELGFEAAVEWFAKHVRSQHGIQVDVQKDMKPIPMDDEIKVLVFRFVRELMMNVVKHAQARRARVVITRKGEEVNIKVEDDGVGFDKSHYQTISSNGGFGLFSIRERLHYLGGRLEVESTDIQGTRVTLMVPLKHDRKTLEG